jgi:hypothetical protein
MAEKKLTQANPWVHGSGGLIDLYFIQWKNNGSLYIDHRWFIENQWFFH